jgi:hypothetical protein
MKVRFKSDKVEIEVDGKDTKDCFSQLSGAVEVFSASECGACESQRVIPSVRENQGNHFYEMRCLDCGAALSYGQRRQDGSLFPRRKTKDGDPIENGGWAKFRRQESMDF